ncbi:probable serine/threonine-protein kinase roco4 [Dreissena polymorpha]|uniref:probable serine/threonine-protein kinase roco4 n=1 Tax=Dreissena polymorpha TaxID=45954 RepID=UPI002264436E|nr:probable serine/threonine-protein kinase roco4 [Dreissena polymorpha]
MLSDKLPKDVQQLDDKAITLFYKALEHGKEKVNNVRLMVVGMCGVGKTSLVNNLIWEFRKQKTNKKTLSTEGIAIHRCKLMTGGDWCLDTELKGVKFGGRIQKVVCNNNQISTNTLSETSASSNYLLVERVTSTEDHETQTQTEPLQTFKESIDLHKKDEIVQQGIKVAKKMLETTSDNSEKSKASLDESKNEITVSVWDFAGQTLYYSTHHFFLNERSIYVVVMDMTRSLKDVVSKSDAIGICCGLVDSCTYLDIFKFWLNSIHMHSDYQSGERTIKPTVILVGTRKDEMQGSAEEKEKNMNLYFDNALCSFDKHSPIFNHIYKNRFLVNNLSPEDTAFAELRKEIISLAAKQDYWGKEYPVRWIHMEQTLDKMRDEKRQIVKMKDVVKEDLENIHPLVFEECIQCPDMKPSGMCTDELAIASYTGRFIVCNSPASPGTSATSTNDISVYSLQHGQLTDEELDTLLSTNWKPPEKHVKEVVNSAISCTPISSRLISIRVSATPHNITIKQVYTPTADYKDEEI